MSFWFYGRRKGGRRKLYSISVPLLPIIAVIGILIALLLPLIRGWLR